jgi:hypothetical protein
MKISPEIAEKRRQDSIQAIATANIPKNAPDRDKVLQETLKFLGQFDGISTTQVKELTLMRQKNGNVDPELVAFSRVATADDLAEALDAHYNAAGLFVLMKGETLKPAAPAMESDGLIAPPPGLPVAAEDMGPL